MKSFIKHSISFLLCFISIIYCSSQIHSQYYPVDIRPSIPNTLNNKNSSHIVNIVNTNNVVGTQIKSNELDFSSIRKYIDELKRKELMGSNNVILGKDINELRNIGMKIEEMKQKIEKDLDVNKKILLFKEKEEEIIRKEFGEIGVFGKEEHESNKVGVKNVKNGNSYEMQFQMEKRKQRKENKRKQGNVIKKKKMLLRNKKKEKENGKRIKKIKKRRHVKSKNKNRFCKLRKAY